MKDDDLFFKETKLHESTSNFLPNSRWTRWFMWYGLFFTGRFRLTPEVRARILWLLAGHWAARFIVRPLENQNTVAPRIMGSIKSWLVWDHGNPLFYTQSKPSIGRSWKVQWFFRGGSLHFSMKRTGGHEGLIHFLPVFWAYKSFGLGLRCNRLSEILLLDSQFRMVRGEYGDFVCLQPVTPLRLHPAFTQPSQKEEHTGTPHMYLYCIYL